MRLHWAANTIQRVIRGTIARRRISSIIEAIYDKELMILKRKRIAWQKLRELKAAIGIQMVIRRFLKRLKTMRILEQKRKIEKMEELMNEEAIKVKKEQEIYKRELTKWYDDDDDDDDNDDYHDNDNADHDDDDDDDDDDESVDDDDDDDDESVGVSVTYVDDDSDNYVDENDFYSDDYDDDDNEDDDYSNIFTHYLLYIILSLSSSPLWLLSLGMLLVKRFTMSL